MSNNRLSRWVSTICAEDREPIILSEKPEIILRKLSTQFKRVDDSKGTIKLYKRTIFPLYHYLEIKIKNEQVEYCLRANPFDRIVASLMIAVAAASIISGSFLVLSAIFYSPEEPHYFVTGLALAGVGTGMILFTYCLYRFLRWFSGLANPLKTLARCGVQ